MAKVRWSMPTRTIAVVGVALVLLAGACGDGATTNAGGVDEVSGPQPDSGDGLALRLMGSIEDRLLCPGGRRTCIPFEGAVEPDADGLVWVGGRLVDGTFVIDAQQPIPVRSFPDYGNRCPDGEISGAPDDELMEAMHEDLARRPPGYATMWDSDDGVFHIGVSGDPGPTEAFLEELGASGQICVVTGFPYPEEVLEQVQEATGRAAAARGFESYGVGRDSWEGTVTIDLPAFDASFRSDLDEISSANDGVPIIAMAGVEVIDSSLDDYEAAMSVAAESPDPADGLAAECGPVRFSSLPPDLDEFPELDEDAQRAVDELANGPTGVEAEGFDTAYRWSIAARSDDRLILFGQGSTSAGQPLTFARFERRDGRWAPTGWGGCNVEIAASGLGPAELATSPDDPPTAEATELALFINEQACASGRAPIDREIVPVVTETDETVTIVVLVAPVEGGADCPGNPWHPITVSLESPLGARRLLDGHVQPPVEIDVLSELG